MNRVTYSMIALAVSQAAFATDPVVTPTPQSTPVVPTTTIVVPSTTVTVPATLAADSQATSDAAAAAAARASSVNGVTFDSDAWAIGLPNMPGAPAVNHDCLKEITGVKQAIAGGWGGRVIIDQDCIKRRDCMAMAGIFFQYNLPQQGIAQLQSCEGAVVLKEETIVVSTEQSSSDEVCDAKIERVFQACQEK